MPACDNRTAPIGDTAMKTILMRAAFSALFGGAGPYLLWIATLLVRWRWQW